MADNDGPWTVRRLLEWTTSFFARKGVESSRLQAELLLAHVLALPRIRLYTEFERMIVPEQLDKFRELVKRCAEGEPTAYLTGKAHFFNLEFQVTRDVLIPRPDTETLVENVILRARNEVGFDSPRILDLCTGSGCIAAALAANLKSATLVATEISPAAAEIARQNLARLGFSDRVNILEGDLFSPLMGLADPQPFHFIVSNPPYIASEQIPKLDTSVRYYEPKLALDGGTDGLDFHRRILADAPARLMPGGFVFLEIAFDQAELIMKLMNEFSVFQNPRILKDNGGNDRVLTARIAK